MGFSRKLVWSMEFKGFMGYGSIFPGNQIGNPKILWVLRGYGFWEVMGFERLWVLRGYGFWEVWVRREATVYTFDTWLLLRIFFVHYHHVFVFEVSLAPFQRVADRQYWKKKGYYQDVYQHWQLSVMCQSWPLGHPWSKTSKLANSFISASFKYWYRVLRSQSAWILSSCWCVELLCGVWNWAYFGLWLDEWVLSDVGVSVIQQIGLSKFRMPSATGYVGWTNILNVERRKSTSIACKWFKYT